MGYGVLAGDLGAVCETCGDVVGEVRVHCW
jgi:hypothetical protein